MWSSVQEENMIFVCAIVHSQEGASAVSTNNQHTQLAILWLVCGDDREDGMSCCRGMRLRTPNIVTKTAARLVGDQRSLAATRLLFQHILTTIATSTWILNK